MHQVHHAFVQPDIYPAGMSLLRSGLHTPVSRRSLSAMAVAAPAVEQSASFAKEAHGFELQQHKFVREYDSHVLMYKHKKTGEDASTTAV